MLHKNQNWKQTKKYETWQGYIRLCNKYDCPYSDKRGRVFEHRHVWWKNYGNKDFIGKDETLHHKNGIKTDNRIENLQKVKRKEHPKLYVKLSKEDIKEYRRNWARKNKDKLNERRRKRRRENLSETRKKESIYREKTRERQGINQNKYRREHRKLINLKNNIAYYTGVYPIGKNMEELEKIKEAMRKSKK